MSSKGIRTPQLVAKDDSCSWLRACGAPFPTPSLPPPPTLSLSRPRRSSSLLRFSIRSLRRAIARDEMVSDCCRTAATVRRASAATLRMRCDVEMVLAGATGRLGRIQSYRSGDDDHSSAPCEV